MLVNIGGKVFAQIYFMPRKSYF